MQYKLDISAETENFFEGAKLLGIIAALKNYKFCWQLNYFLGFNFQLNPDKEIRLRKKNRNYNFFVYENKLGPASLKHYLYHNHCDGEYLLPEFKHVDFLWMMKSDFYEEDKWQEIISTLKKFKDVLLITEMNIEELKNKNNLIL